MHEAMRDQLAELGLAPDALPQHTEAWEAFLRWVDTQLREADEVAATARQAQARADRRVAHARAAAEADTRAKTEFLANMSHELRTPLSAILGLSEGLMRGVRGPLNARQQRSAELINESGQHLLDLINDILDLSKIEAGRVELQPATIAVDDVCRASLDMVRPAAREGRITLELDLDDAPETVRADERRLKQILVNLLSNAVKFTPPDGTVRLEVQARPEQRSMAFTVSDTGIGMSQAELQRVFLPFVQADSRQARSRGGTGLGLALVSQLAQLHDGDVSVVSEPGQGSRFTITLPWQPQANRAANGISAATTPGPITPAKPSDAPLILVAEDDEGTREVIRDFLTSAGYRVATAHTGLQAVRQALELTPALVLMDIRMPKLDGLDAIRQLRAKQPEHGPRIVAVTAYAQASDEAQCLSAGADAYLSKPFHMSQLLEHVHAQLDNGAH